MDYYVATFRMGSSDFTTRIDLIAQNLQHAERLAEEKLFALPYLTKYEKKEMLLVELEKVKAKEDSCVMSMAS